MTIAKTTNDDDACGKNDQRSLFVLRTVLQMALSVIKLAFLKAMLWALKTEQNRPILS